MFIKNLIILYLLIVRSYSLSPGKLPNGKVKKYIPNIINPKNDLKLINSQQAMLITRNWMENILKYIDTNQIINSDSNKETEDKHILTRINQLENYIQSSNKENKEMFFAWMPKCKYKSSDTLFIVIVEIDNNNSFYICQLIQSPFWSPIQIESDQLKNSLLDYCKKNNYKINFDKLYCNDQRYKLAWSTWDLRDK